LSFASRLVTEPQREKSGETGAQRYDYQALWGLSLIFSHHATGADYAISFEFHDDIILLDSASAPSQASFYQVKTKAKGHWTLSDLTSRKKKRNDPQNGSLPSHMGKLYSNYTIFPSDTDKLFFVSNVPCEFFDAAATECRMSDTAPKTLTDITAKLRAEYPSATSSIVDIYKRIDCTISETGSDLPRALLAYYLAFIHTMRSSTQSLLCPLIIDTPVQQDQDATNAARMIDMCLNGAPADTQIILGTVGLHGVQYAGSTIGTENKYRLLNKSDYQEVH
jgi:hypothetical protein